MTDTPNGTPRARDLGLPFPGQPGPWNAITDVAGVSVGMVTLCDPARRMRTGVTAIRPRDDSGHPLPVTAGMHALNGNGEMTGTHWIGHAGTFLGPVCITNTHAIGAVHEGAVRWMLDHYAPHFRDGHAWAMPVVAETYDGLLNDITTLHVRPDHAVEAIRSARSGPVAEGAVGGGTGMIAYEFKAGTGTASRRFTIDGRGFTLGVLVQANHGRRPDFTVLGKPVGALMPEGAFRPQESGSIIVVIATDVPLSAIQLQAVARRATIGLGRGGTPGGNSSGDIFLAFSTANPRPVADRDCAFFEVECLNIDRIDTVYHATVQAVEEAVVNAIVAGRDTPAVKPEGLIVPGIDHARLRQIFA